MVALPKKSYWNTGGRWLVFLLAASSIACLLFDFYRLCQMRLFTVFIFLLAALAYDTFRLPFVFAKEWGIASVIPPMKLFKVFPRFGAMILGQPIEQSSYSMTTQIVGWIYHFSNGATFGVMYVAMIGHPTRRHWVWAVVMALALELGLLLTPYPQVFNIP